VDWLPNFHPFPTLSQGEGMLRQPTATGCRKGSDQSNQHRLGSDEGVENYTDPIKGLNKDSTKTNKVLFLVDTQQI